MNKQSLDYYDQLKMYKQATLERYHNHKTIRFAECYGMSPENLKKLEDEFDKLKLENKSFNLNTGESDSLELFENKLLLIL